MVTASLLISDVVSKDTHLERPYKIIATSNMVRVSITV